MKGWLNRLLGNRGERLAARYLRRQGYRILSRQYRTRLGELDLIAMDRECIVFVEVKTRRSDAAGQPIEAITHQKQKKLTQLALTYLKRYGLLEHAARFDVVALCWDDSQKKPPIKHYKNAFPAVGFGQMFC